jgi:arabinose-5-phosphate isomerase
MSESNIHLDLAREIIQAEGQALLTLTERLGDPFCAAAEMIHRCTGQIVLTGIGKAGLVAQKISATMASTGTRSIFLHPVEALHGDLGRVSRDDVIIALSHSGSTEEVVRLIDHIKARGAGLIAMTGLVGSPLAQHADIALTYGQVEEACPHGVAPTVSTTCMLALGDALSLVVMTMRQFGPEDFAAFHPGGTLMRRLLKVEEVMGFRPGDHLNLVSDALTLGEAIAEAEKADRRSGAMLLVDADGKLSGIFTDADLRRKILEHRGTSVLDMPVREMMTANPKHVHQGVLASEALAMLNQNRIDELPVIDDDGRPVGIIDVQDLLGIKTVSDG